MMTFRFARITLILAGLLCLLGVSNVRAQDPQFSQFYANQVLLSPAFAGSGDGPRLALNARSQWSAIPGNYRTFAMGFDMPLIFGPTRHGVGLVVQADQAGDGNLTKTDFLLNYSYRWLLNDNHAIRFGLAAGIQQATIDFTRLRFPNQYDPVSGFDPSRNSGENANDSRIHEEIAAGFTYYNRFMWLGFTAHHLTTPQQQFTKSGPGQDLPMRFALFTGFNIALDNNNGVGSPSKYITPAIMFRYQKPFTQLDLGAYLTLDPLVLGVFFRAAEPDAVIGLVGIQKGRFRAGYSYDFTVSSLTNQISGGSHEISAVIEFDPLPRARHKPSVNMSCPKF